MAAGHQHRRAAPADQRARGRPQPGRAPPGPAVRGRPVRRGAARPAADAARRQRPLAGRGPPQPVVLRLPAPRSLLRRELAARASTSPCSPPPCTRCSATASGPSPARCTSEWRTGGTRPAASPDRRRPVAITPATEQAGTGSIELVALPQLAGPRRRGGGHVLILVQNLPVPLDRRVWLECQALVGAGLPGVGHLPEGPGRSRRPGARRGAHPQVRPPAGGQGHRRLRARVRRCPGCTATAWPASCGDEDPFDVIQACNPPDTFFLIGRLFRSRGVRFVFDHHDLCPEIYRSRFGRDGGLALSLLLALERATFSTADHVISTNESYRAVALNRGRKRRADTTVVRSRARPGGHEAGRARSVAEDGAPAPVLLPRHHGPPGRRRHGAAGRGRARQPTGTAPMCRSPSWASATPTTTCGRCAPSWA